MLDDVLKFNKGVRAAPTAEEFKKRAFLVQGVFPQPADAGFVELSEFPRKFAVESVPALLNSIRAGEPADPAKLAADLELKRKQELEAATPPGGSAEAIPEPKFVRMGWRDTAIPNLKDKDAWPVFAFPSQPVAQPAISQAATP